MRQQVTFWNISPGNYHQGTFTGAGKMGKELVLSIIVSVVLGIAILSTVYALVWITKEDSVGKSK